MSRSVALALALLLAVSCGSDEGTPPASTARTSTPPTAAPAPTAQAPTAPAPTAPAPASRAADSWTGRESGTRLRLDLPDSATIEDDGFSMRLTVTAVEESGGTTLVQTQVREFRFRADDRLPADVKAELAAEGVGLTGAPVGLKLARSADGREIRLAWQNPDTGDWTDEETFDRPGS